MRQSLNYAIRSSLHISLPVASTFLLNMLTGFIAVFYLSRLGSTVLAASALIIGVQVTLIVLAMSILFSISITVGRSYGQSKYSAAARLLQQGWILALLVSIFVTLIFSNAAKILLFAKQSEVLVNIASQYFAVIVWGVPAILLHTCNAQFSIGTSKQKLVALASLCGLVSMIISSYGLAFGHFGLPRLGVAGVAWGWVIQYWVMFFFLLAHLKFNPFFRKFKLFHRRRLKRFKEIKQLLKLGWPISMQIGTELLAILTITLMTGWLGKLSLSARQVTSQYLIFTIVPIIGISQASGVLVSQYIGRKNFLEVSRIVSINILLALSFVVWFLLAFIFIPNTLASLYIDIANPKNAHLLQLIRYLFLIACVSQLFDCVRNVTSGALRGLYDTQFPMYVGIIGLWFVALPLGYYLAFKINLGVIGLSIGFAAGITIASILQLIRWFRRSHPTYLTTHYS